jgi:hypothetical protein
MRSNTDLERKRALLYLCFYFISLCSADSALTDPLVHRGRHFGRVAYAFCSIKVLVTNGLLRMANDDARPLESIA